MQKAVELGCTYYTPSDDGYTGTTINRPALTKMLQDVKAGEVSCIVVKDFSRFMRNHIMQGEYLEILFPCIGVRFISINDNYDSKVRTNDLMLPIKGLTYELYARDISKKIKSIKQNQAQNGTLKVGEAG